MLSKACQWIESAHKNLCVFVWGVLCYTKADWFTRRVEFGNGGGDLIRGLVTGGVGGPWLRPGLEDRRRGNKGGGYSTSPFS